MQISISHSKVAEQKPISQKLPDPVFVIFSFLPTEVLFHRIALLNKKTRARLPTWRLLDQPKELTIKIDKFWIKPPVSHFKYVFSLVDIINV